MADNKKRGRFSKGPDDAQSIFDLFEPPPEQEASSFGRIPIIRDDDEDSLDLTNVEYVEAQAAAEAEAAGLRHWTEPATGQVPAALGADVDERSGEVSGPSWRGEDPNWAGPDLSDVFADTDGIRHDRVSARRRDESAPKPAPARRQAPESRPAAPTARRGQAPSIFDDSPRLEPANGRVSAPPSAQPPPPGGGPVPDPGVPTRGATPAAARADRSDAIDNPPAPERRPGPARPNGRVKNEVRANPAERAEPRRRERAVRAEARADLGSESRPHDARGADQLEWAAGSDDPATGIDLPRRRPTLEPEAQPRPAPRGDAPPAGRPNLAEPDPRRARLLQAPPEDEPFAEEDDYEEYDEYDDEPKGRNLGQAFAVGIALSALAAVAIGLGPMPAVILVGVFALLAVMELFNGMRLAGLRPATLLGLVGTIALPAATYVRGDAGYPLVIGLAVVFGMLWYLTGADTERPVLNLGLTLMGILWVGGLAGFAALLVRAEGGTELLLAVIIITAVSDTLAYLGGRAYGAKPFHSASPNKTWEGTLTGFFGALFAGLVFGVTDVIGAFNGEFVSVIVMALVIGILVPIGDLAESLVKRDLGIKDMGTLLPGHGGVLDRMDGLLFALPGAYYVAVVFELI
jgi:phosphatidate cytidylyltransferase